MFFLLIFFAAVVIFSFTFGFMGWLEDEELNISIPIRILLHMITIVAFYFVWMITEQLDDRQKAYEASTVTEIHSTTVKRLEIIRTEHFNGSRRVEKDEMVMVLQDGTVKYVDNHLYASLTEGEKIYWESCVKNCDYYDEEKVYFVKD